MRADQRVARDAARLPRVFALRARERRLVNLIEVAELAGARRKHVSNVAVHVDLKDPVTDLVALGLRKQVLLGQRNLVGRRDVCAFELGVLRDHVGLGVDDSIPKVNVPVEEDEGHVVLVNSAVSVASIKECLIGTNILAIAKERCGKLSADAVQFVLDALGL